MSLSFKKTKITTKNLEKLINFNNTAFTDALDVKWSIANIKKQINAGWEIYTAEVDGEIASVLFIKNDDQTLLTKSTPLRIDFRGQGFSHEIMDFYESLAKKNKKHKIYNYCRSDNFRMISLNETHGYRKTGNVFNEDLAGSEEGSPWIEWGKKI